LTIRGNHRERNDIDGFKKERDEQRNNASGISSGDGETSQAPEVDGFFDRFLDVFRIKSVKFLLIFR
jgi:hypothetical protein